MHNNKHAINNVLFYKVCSIINYYLADKYFINNITIT